MLGEQQIAEEHRAGLLIEHGHVVVGVRRRMRLDQQLAVAEVELEPVFDELGRRNDARAFERLAEQLFVAGEIALGARRQRARQLGVPDEHRLLAFERDVAEHVVGMHVGVDHVLDRQLGARADGRQKLGPDAWAAARVDDRNAVAADDEARVRGVAGVARREDLVASLMHENARRNFVNGERFLGAGRGARRREKKRLQVTL